MTTLAAALAAIIWAVGTAALFLLLVLHTVGWANNLVISKTYYRLFKWLPAKPFFCGYCMAFWMAIIPVIILVSIASTSTPLILGLFGGVALSVFVYTLSGVYEYLS